MKKERSREKEEEEEEEEVEKHNIKLAKLATAPTSQL